MASQVTKYQCPSCMGPLHFVGKSGKLECDYCGSIYEVAEIEAMFSQQNSAAAQAFQEAPEQAAEAAAYAGDWGEDAEHMRAYNCPTCGAQIICDDTTAATGCPYCGNPAVIPGQFEGALKPEYIIPFKLSKEDAVAQLKNYYKGKKLLPKAFADNNHIEEIKGIYVPFWLYDGVAEADITFAAQRSRTYERGDNRITETDHFVVRRAGSAEFRLIPADGSSRMPDAHMDAIEPFDYGEIKPFSMSYLPGFYADRYDVSAQECKTRATSRAENTIAELMRNDVSGYTSVVTTHKMTNVPRLKTHYALMPVWLLNTKWNGENNLFAMNGQTGKMVGNLPISAGKVLAWFAGISVPLIGVMIALLMYGL